MVTDLTSGRPIKALLFFSLPMLFGNLIQQFYNMVDLIVVGRVVGTEALAAVGATSSLLFFVFSLVGGLTNGASVVVAQHYGAGDHTRVKRAVATSILVLGVSTIVLTLFGVLVTEPILRLLDTPEHLIPDAAGYLKVIFGGTFAIVAYNGSANIIRALGDSITPLIYLIVAVALNIFLDILFVAGFRMGVAGAAWATVLAQIIASAGCIVYAYRKMPLLRLTREDFQWDGQIFRQTIRLGIPSGIQNSLIAIGGMAVQGVVNSFGPQIMAAYASANKLDQLAVQPLLTLGMASATFTAQNMGAGKVQRAKEGFWAAITLSTIFCILVTTLLYFFGKYLLRMFVESQEVAVLSAGEEYLRIVSLFYVILGAIVILENMLRGAGDVLTPMISCGVEIGTRVLVAIALSNALGYAGIWWNAPVAWMTGTIICGWRYLSGKWQYKSLISTAPPTP